MSAHLLRAPATERNRNPILAVLREHGRTRAVAWCIRGSLAAVELGLRTLLRLRQQEQIKRFRGKLHWQGDLDTMRLDG